MKRTLTLLIAAAAMMCGTMVSAQNLSAKDKDKIRQEQTKINKKKLNEKASKEARNEAKKLQKEGWKTAPGALPIEKQLDKSYLLQMETNEYGEPEYIMAEAMSTGGNYDAAKMQALELAKQNLAGQIQTEVTALVENTVSNAQLDQGDAASITKSIAASKNLISQSLGRTVPVVEVYRVVNGNNREVLVRLAYSMTNAKKVAMNVVRQDLEERGDSLHNKLDKILGW